MATRRSLTNWHYCDYGNLHYKGILCAECSEEMSSNFRKERQQGKAKVHIARESRRLIREATVLKPAITCCGEADGADALDDATAFPDSCSQASSTCVRDLTPWQKADNYARNTSGSWNYKQSPYCSVPECYNTPVMSLRNRTCWCEKHLHETDPVFLL